MTSKLRVVTRPRGSGLECFSNWKEAFVTLTTGRETASGRPSVQPLQPAFPGGGRSSSRRLKSPPRVPRRPGTRPCPAGPPPGCRPPACQPRPGAGPGEPSRVRVAARRPGVHAPASHRHLDSRAATVARDGGLPPSPPELDPRNTQLLFCAERSREAGAVRGDRCVLSAGRGGPCRIRGHAATRGPAAGFWLSSWRPPSDGPHHQPGRGSTPH